MTPAGAPLPTSASNTGTTLRRAAPKKEEKKKESVRSVPFVAGRRRLPKIGKRPPLKAPSTGNRAFILKGGRRALSQKKQRKVLTSAEVSGVVLANLFFSRKAARDAPNQT